MSDLVEPAGLHLFTPSSPLTTSMCDMTLLIRDGHTKDAEGLPRVKGIWNLSWHGRSTLVCSVHKCLSIRSIPIHAAVFLSTACVLNVIVEPLFLQGRKPTPSVTQLINYKRQKSQGE